LAPYEVVEIRTFEKQLPSLTCKTVHIFREKNILGAGGEADDGNGVQRVFHMAGESMIASATSSGML